MDARLKNYCDISKIFLTNVSCLQDCLIEANKTQQMLVELVELKEEFEKIYNRTNQKFEIFMADKRTSIKNILDKNSVKNVTREVIEDRVVHLYTEDYEQLRKDRDEAKMNFDLCNDLRMVLFQRKDIISHTIEFLKFQKDQEACILHNQQFVKKLMEKI